MASYYSELIVLQTLWLQSKVSNPNAIRYTLNVVRRETCVALRGVTSDSVVNVVVDADVVVVVDVNIESALPCALSRSVALCLGPSLFLHGCVGHDYWPRCA